jgi:putative membrane protein
VGSLSASTVTVLRDLETLLADSEALMKTSGNQLDSGTRQALQGLSATLRQTAKAMAATSDVRAAKATINTIIEDTWHEYTGDVNNILMMDAGTQAVSLTDSRNPAPSSVQVLIRTQEIKAEELTAEQLAAAAPEKTTFRQRVAQMFQDFWRAVTSIFH